ncbi:MAG TPA: orotidine-5'-phosphate decarboxylase [Acidimicrobiales bacterium]|nr:orotidine-5'-phosphate decarboxylase [Acidimicrobiales bacterium]
MTDFTERWLAAADKFGHLCVGIDPHTATLSKWSLPNTAAGAREFAHCILDACVGAVGIVKPQSAFFERFGGEGLTVLDEIVQRAQSEGMMAILDAKRGDIGSTMEAYAEAAYGGVDRPAADASTFSPYLGVGDLEPAFRAAANIGAAVLVVTQTSNPDGRGVQTARTGGGATVQQSVVDDSIALTAQLEIPAATAGFVVSPAVTGAAEVDVPIGHAILVPGIGAQGLTPQSARAAFPAELQPYLILAASRVVSDAGPDAAALEQRVADLGRDSKAA